MERLGERLGGGRRRDLDVFERVLFLCLPLFCDLDLNSCLLVGLCTFLDPCKNSALNRSPGRRPKAPLPSSRRLATAGRLQVSSSVFPLLILGWRMQLQGQDTGDSELSNVQLEFLPQGLLPAR